jgi:hypothetical protein
MTQATARRFRACPAVMALALLLAVPLRAAPGDDLSCAHFSSDPDDRSGPPIRFFATLSADGQRAPTVSAGVGQAHFVLDRDTLKFSWRVSFDDLTSPPVALRIHGPLPAEGEAPALFDIAPEGFRSPVEGERILSVGEVTYLVSNSLYINVLTKKYPDGEIRGRVRKLRPEC